MLRAAANDEIAIPEGAWAGSAEAVEGLLRWVVADLDRCPSVVVERSEFDMYGSGYASFVDVLLTWRDGSARVADDNMTRVRGLAVGLCRLAPIAALFADVDIAFCATSGASYLPSLETAASNPVTGWEDACRDIVQVLDRHGILLLDRETLSTSIDPALTVETVLTDRPPYTIFDAWFHWMD
ncbi:hypothetical protein [Qaidamihabitans albus]|uniref:hypothetical protein n=1 Tax=Qaidamihabitans albus TaxID=2795733 RepID=UPI0027DBF97F|nr:hypothetical protein [Qaidamihabitans albus]